MVNKWLHLKFGVCQTGVENAMNSQIALAIESPITVNRYVTFYLVEAHARSPTTAHAGVFRLAKRMR